jgi:hypothetical protein
MELSPAQSMQPLLDSPMTTPSIRIMRGTSLLALGWLLSAVPIRAAEAAAARPNVLFIMADDLNHWVGYTGRNKQTITPHIDRLSAMGLSFTHANCAGLQSVAHRAILRPATGVDRRLRQRAGLAPGSSR